jgi:hypothetical protein
MVGVMSNFNGRPEQLVWSRRRIQVVDQADKPAVSRKISLFRGRQRGVGQWAAAQK